MNKSLKFLAIGLALAVLLVSQVGVDRSTEAATIEGTNDTVEFAGPADDMDKANEQQDFYRPGVTADFYLKDPDLALPTNTATITFTVPVNGRIDPSVGLRLRVPPELLDTNGDGDTPSGAYAPSHEATGTTTLETGFGAGQTSLNDTGVTYMVNDHWARYMGDASTPIDGRPTITVRSAPSGVPSGDRFVTIYDPNTGEISGFVGEAVTGRNAQAESSPGAGDGFATTTVKVSFKYHVSDVFTVNQRAGTTAGPDQNRARVTSSSDGIGEWVELTEVAEIGSTAPHPTSNIYHGSIYLERDSTKASRTAGEIGVRDGDTLTVTFYEEDQITVVDDDTATIDGEKPAIVSISPADKTVTDRSSPVVTISVADAGSGFDTSFPREHVDISIIEGEGVIVCRIPDSRLTATRLNSNEVDILFRNTGSWVSGGAGINCDPGSDPAPTEEDPDAMEARSTLLNYKANSKSIDPGDNNHGEPFTIKVVARDVAGNLSEKEVSLTIDTDAPALDDGSTTGVNWDAKEKKEVSDRSAIKVVFNEALDASTVDVSDFEVENPDASIESLQVAGADANNADSKNEVVYLKLSSDLASDARPRVELDGSIMDKAGNELKTAAISRTEDGIKPGITVDAFSAQLLADEGESAITFSADENLAANTAAVADDECTCLSITGGSDVEAARGAVNLPTPSNGTYTFNAGSITGIFGVLVQGSDIRAQVTREGAVKVTDEVTKAADVSGGEIELTPHDEDAEVVASTTVARFTVTVSLAKWPLADANFSISLDDDVTIKGADGVSDEDIVGAEGAAIPGSKVTDIDWEDGTVTLELTYSDEDTTLANDDELMVTYHYVKAEQTVEVDLAAPTATFMPDGDTQESRPFIRIQWDETEYAGDTNTTVTVTSATLTDPDGNETVLVDDETNLLSSSDQKLFSYLPGSDLALGEYTITAVGRDAAGNVSEVESDKFKVVARPPVSIPLNLGWNLISLPAEAADSAIDAVINVDEVSQVLTYDPTVEGGWLAAVRVNGAFEGGLTTIEASKAYLVYTTSVDPLKVDIPGLSQGTQEFPPTIQLYAGWNMVPASSLDPDFPKRDIDSYLSGVKWSRGYYYDTDGRLTGFIPGDDDDEDELVEKGRGFLIYVTEDSTLVP